MLGSVSEGSRELNGYNLVSDDPQPVPTGQFDHVRNCCRTLVSTDRFAANVDVVGLLIGDGLAVSVDVVVGFGRAAVVARGAIVLGADLARKVVDVVVAGRAGAFAVAVLAVVGLLTVL